ncbi:MAG TPA: 4-hydroxythreonine-4-phosphate dehydrogenase PdxA [Bacteroidales bacterium]
MIQHKETDEAKPVRIGITHGDFNGISYEVILKALDDSRITELFTPVIYCIPKVLSYHRKNMNLEDFNYKIIQNTRQLDHKKINVVSLSNEEVKVEHGISNKIAGQFAFQALEAAVADLKDKLIDVLVTAPVNKANIQSENFNFPGHTEYLTERFGSTSSLMLLVHQKLRIGTITGHIPLNQVASSITEDLILSKITILDSSLKNDFGIQRPKIAILGLNPHAGDDGVIGDEEKRIIQPAIAAAKKQGFLVFGPFPADGFFGSDEYTKYDGILAMYHDQGLIPFKTLSFKSGVNFTAGLPIVRTSPAHGTAYEIAGKDLASPESIRQAMFLAIDIFRNRNSMEEMNANPLPSSSSNERNGRNYSDSDSMH